MPHIEIESCAASAKNGSEEDLLKILKQYKPFIFKTARKFNIKNHDIYDLEQIGYMAIINAISKYRTGSCTFSSYAYESIKNAIRYTARKNSRHEKELSLNSTAYQCSANIKYINSIASHENIEEAVLGSEEATEIRKMISKLPPQELELVLMLYYKGHSLKDYADKKGITYYQATKKRNHVLGKLGRYFKQ